MISATNLRETAYFCELLKLRPTSNFRGIKLTKDDKVLAVAGYDDFTLNAVQMHIWIANPKGFWSKQFIQECFRFPFEICNLGIVIGVTPGDNTRALEFNRRVGLKETYRVKDGWSPGTDMVIQEMRREHCRWIKGDRNVRTGDQTRDEDSGIQDARSAGEHGTDSPDRSGVRTPSRNDERQTDAPEHTDRRHEVLTA